MGASKRKKIVMDYFRSLGISKIDDIDKEFNRVLGEEAAKLIIEKWDKLNPAVNNVGKIEKAGLQKEHARAIDQTELYDFMNQDFTTSMVFSSATDANIYFKVCGWINDHMNAFMGNILDIGCGNGIITCFIAKVFPERKVTGVDRSHNSITVANELKAKLNLENVTFIYDALGASAGNEFNTVFSSRTVHENIGYKLTRFIYLPFDDQVATYYRLYSEYTETVSNRIADGGRFISFERFDNCDTDYYGFLKALNANGLKTDFSYYSIIEAKETNLVSKSKFTITVADKTSKRSENELFDLWSKYAFANTSDISRFTRPQIDYYVRENAGNVRFGYISYDMNPDAQSVRCVVYDLKNDQRRFLVHRENSQNAQLIILDNADEFEARAVFEDNKRHDRKNGFTVIDIEPGSKY